jgi:hypothetical protein
VTAYTDGVHLIADSRDELHAFAASIGLRRCWFHRDHYDLTTDARTQRAVRAGALVVTSRAIVARLIQTRQRRRPRRRLLVYVSEEKTG